MEQIVQVRVPCVPACWGAEWVVGGVVRSGGTVSNYFGYVKTGCAIVGAPVTVFDDPAISRAKMAIDKARRFTPRKELWVQRPLLERMVAWSERRPQEMRLYIKLFVLAYAFLLRLPSEALPAVVGFDGFACSANAVLYLDGDCLVLQLRRRKNRNGGSKLTRKCWCSASMSTCPVCTFRPLVVGRAPGTPLFPDFTPSSALQVLRVVLGGLGVPDPELYRTHDLRRGHAQDLVASGAPLHEILRAGEWSSPAFLSYLNLHKLETDMVVQAHLDESDGDES